MTKEKPKTNKITYDEIWDFIQTHKNKTKAQFGNWTIEQTFRLTDKIFKAIVRYNNYQKK